MTLIMKENLLAACLLFVYFKKCLKLSYKSIKVTFSCVPLNMENLLVQR